MARGRWVAGAVVAAALLASIPGDTAPGGSSTRRTRAWIDTITAKGNFSVTFSVDDTRTTTAYLGLPPQFGDEQRYNACTSLYRSKYLQNGTVWEAISHSGCGDVPLTFDPVAWTATIAGSVPAVFQKSTYLKRANGTWRLSAFNRNERSIPVDLTFTGTGELRNQTNPNPNTLGYLYLSGSFWKDTTVSGSLRYYIGSQKPVPVPRGHTGHLVLDHSSTLRAQ